MARLTLTVTDRQAGRSVRSLLRGELGLSTGCVNRLKRTETGLTCNGVRVFTNAVVRAGDVLAADLSAGEVPTAVSPVPMALDIAFEDEHLLVVNKSAPLAVIPSSLVPGEPTLAAGLMAYLGPSASLHPVNRLDRGTTGLMVVAKNRFTHNAQRQLLHTGDFCREYRGITVGAPDPPEGIVDLPIGRAEGSPIKRCIRPDGAAAVTRYETLETAGNFALLRLLPQTGRTHQLRLHMAALGHPLAGDWLYGTEAPDLIPRPALHAYALALRHPITRDRLSFQAELPEDMAHLLR